MDEFQDTNGQQARLLRLVRPPDRFYAVGDINQSIFGFRHAEPRGFLEYRDDVERRGRHVVELVDNFRSRPEILSAVETVLDGAARHRAAAAWWRGGCSKLRGRTRWRRLRTRPASADEARWVARRILELTRAVHALPRRRGAGAEYGSDRRVHGGLRGGRHSVHGEPRPGVLRDARGERPDAPAARDRQSARRNQPGGGAALAAGGRVGRSAAGAADDGREYRRVADAAGREATRSGSARRTFAAAATLRDAPARRGAIRRESVSFDRLLAAAIDDCGYRPASGSRGDANIDKFLAQARAAAARQSLDEFVERAGAGARRQPARAGRAAGGRGGRREGDDRPLGQGAGVSGRVRGGDAQRRRQQPSGGRVLAPPLDWARAGATRPSARTRTTGSCTPSAKSGKCGKRRRATACSTWP